MKHFIFLLLLIPMLAFSQQKKTWDEMGDKPVTIQNLKDFLTSSRQDTVGYTFVIEQRDTIVTAAVEIYHPAYRKALEGKNVVFAPDGYVFQELPLWGYLKWRYKNYTDADGHVKLLQGYIRVVPIVVSITPVGTLQEFVQFLEQRK
jgi:hypothetical protein